MEPFYTGEETQKIVRWVASLFRNEEKPYHWEGLTDMECFNKYVLFSAIKAEDIDMMLKK